MGCVLQSAEAKLVSEISNSKKHHSVDILLARDIVNIVNTLPERGK